MGYIVNILPNFFFSFVPILCFIVCMSYYIRKSIKHDLERKYIHLFNEINLDEKKKMNKEDEQFYPLIKPERNKLEEHFKHEEIEINPILSDNLLFLNEMKFLPTNLAVFALKHVNDRIIWTDTPFYQIKKYKKMKYLFNLLAVSFTFNLLFLIISYFLVKDENSL